LIWRTCRDDTLAVELQGVERRSMDLAAALPLLLPQAIAWAQDQTDETLAVGVSLGLEALANARRVGVLAPERVRVKVVDALPLPEDPVLRAAALQAGLLGPGMIGLTLGYAIFIRKGHLGLRVLSHECRHVQQYESRGGIAAILPIYLADVVAVGYAASSFEADARSHEIGPPDPRDSSDSLPPLRPAMSRRPLGDHEE